MSRSRGGSAPWRVSLRIRLLLLVGLAVLPAFALIAWSAYEEREARLNDAEKFAERVASGVAAEFAQIVDFTRQTLDRLANEPVVRQLTDLPACNRRLAEVRKLHPAFGLIGVVGRDGQTLCSDSPRAVGVNLADRDYFRQAVATRGFVVSGFIVGRTTGMNIMVLAAPVLDDAGAVTAVIFLSLDLKWIRSQMLGMALPPDSDLMLVDGGGKVIAATAGAAPGVGDQIPELDTFLAAAASGHVPAVRIAGADGIRRIVASVPLPGAPRGSAFVRAAIPTAAIDEHADRILLRGALVFAGVALLVFGAAWWFAGLLVVAPTRRLIAAAESLGRGDMAARSQLAHGGDELGQLAAHFDDMAARLQRLTRTQHTLSAGNRALLRGYEEGALLDEMCRIAVREGGYRLAWVGYLKRGSAEAIVPVAVAAVDPALQAWIEADGHGDGPAAAAIRLGSVQVAHAVDVPVAAGSPALPTRLAVCALPLRGNERPLGALTLYADDAESFDHAELELLDEMAADLAFGIQTLRDRHEHALAEERIRQMAYVDELTGLPNRIQLELLCATALTAAGKAGEAVAVVAVSLEHFTRIQNAIGFAEGDRLLVEVAHRLRAAAEPAWTVARLVSDRFAILVPGAGANAAKALAHRLAAEFERPFAVADIDTEVSANFGIAVYPEHGGDPALLVRRADVACIGARASGYGIEVYRGQSENEGPERLQRMVDLRRAIEDDQLAVHYQGKVSVPTGAVTGAEALLRWRHPVHGNVPPAAFIPDAEQTGLIKPLTFWVLEHVVHQLREWNDEKVAVPVAVNLSARNFRDPALLTRLRHLLAASNVRPGLLQIEITETALMEDPPAAEGVLAQMRALGLLILIDDFGTGYSSLRYLASLPVDVIKIDRSFIIEMESRPEMRALVGAIVDMGHKLGLKVVAEGVDDERQAAILGQVDCDEIQGFLYCTPRDATAFREWVATRPGAGH